MSQVTIKVCDLLRLISYRLNTNTNLRTRRLVISLFHCHSLKPELHCPYIYLSFESRHKLLLIWIIFDKCFHAVLSLLLLTKYRLSNLMKNKIKQNTNKTLTFLLFHVKTFNIKLVQLYLVYFWSWVKYAASVDCLQLMAKQKAITKVSASYFWGMISKGPVWCKA